MMSLKMRTEQRQREKVNVGRPVVHKGYNELRKYRKRREEINVEEKADE